MISIKFKDIYYNINSSNVKYKHKSEYVRDLSYYLSDILNRFLRDVNVSIIIFIHLKMALNKFLILLSLNYCKKYPINNCRCQAISIYLGC
jgi:hypothetical protein